MNIREFYWQRQQVVCFTSNRYLPLPRTWSQGPHPAMERVWESIHHASDCKGCRVRSAHSSVLEPLLAFVSHSLCEWCSCLLPLTVPPQLLSCLHTTSMPAPLPLQLRSLLAGGIHPAYFEFSWELWMLSGRTQCLTFPTGNPKTRGPTWPSTNRASAQEGGLQWPSRLWENKGVPTAPK